MTLRNKQYLTQGDFSLKGSVHHKGPYISDVRLRISIDEIQNRHHFFTIEKAHIIFIRYLDSRRCDMQIIQNLLFGCFGPAILIVQGIFPAKVQYVMMVISCPAPSEHP